MATDSGKRSGSGRIACVVMAVMGFGCGARAIAQGAAPAPERAESSDAAPAVPEAQPPEAAPAESAPAEAAPAEAAAPAAGEAAPPPAEATAPAAGATTAADTAPEIETPSAPTSLDDLVITATKRKQTVREIPTTVNVMTGEKLENLGARQLSDFIDQVPGIKMEDQAGVGPRKISVRGVGPDDNTNQTVGTVLGDVPLGDPYGSYTIVDPDPFDLETVEVLKGPQGSLFGASSLSGLIRYVPNAPVLGNWEGKAFAQWTSVHDGGAAPTYGAMLNAPLGSTLALRGAGVIERTPGYIDFDTPGYVKQHGDDADKYFGRVMALWQPTDRLSINLLGMKQDAHADQMSWVTNPDYQLKRDDSPGTNPYRRAFQMASLDARYAFDWATLVSLSGYQDKSNHFDQDLTYNFELEPLARQGVTVIRALRDVQAYGYIQELRLVSPDDGGPWNWIAGAFYSKYDARIESNVYIPYAAAATQLVQGLLGDLSQAVGDEHGVTFGKQVLDPLIAKERALFGELSRSFGSLKLTVGGRYYRTAVNGVSASSGLAATAANHQAVTTSEPAVESSGFSPKFAIAWQFTPDFLVYTSAAKGFQFGGINVVPIPIDRYPATYGSSTLWSYEAGVRTDWLHRTLRADLSVFYLDWKNAQVFQVGSSSVDSWVDNVGAVRSRGVESTLRYIFPWEGLTLEVSGAYLDARTTVPFTGSNGATVEEGTVMPNSPPLQTSTTLSYTRPLFDFAWMGAGALNYTHTNEAWNNINHTGRLDPRDMINLNLSLARTAGTLRPAAAFVVTNLTNQVKKVSVTTEEGNSQLNGNPFLYSRPRTMQVRLSVDF